jgi:hypothetical protein
MPPVEQGAESSRQQRQRGNQPEVLDAQGHCVDLFSSALGASWNSEKKSSSTSKVLIGFSPSWRFSNISISFCPSTSSIGFAQPNRLIHVFHVGRLLVPAHRDAEREGDSNMTARMNSSSSFVGGPGHGKLPAG